MDSYLSHHGILGQKWGVRRYQNKDGSLTAAGKARLEQNKEYALKARRHERLTWKDGADDDSEDLTVAKGGKFYRVGGENETNTGSTYAVTDINDYYKYAAAGAAMEINGNTKYTLVAQNQMKFAGARQQMDAVIKVYGSMPYKEFVEKLSGTKDRKSREYYNTKYDVDRMFNEREDDNIMDSHYFDAVMRKANQQLMDRDNEIGKAVVKELMSKGYSGVRDTNDGNFSNTPLYIFDRSELVVKGRKKISEAEKRIGEKRLNMSAAQIQSLRTLNDQIADDFDDFDE